MAIKINGITVIDDSRVGNLAAATAVGNVQAGNVLTTGLISATGNITGNFILGNGSQLTGIDATSIQSGTSNVRVVSSGGNVAVGVGGTANITVFATTGAFVTGAMSASGNVTGGNLVTAGIATVTGNVQGGNLRTTGQVSATGNISGGNLLIANNAVITGNLTVQGTETIFNTQTLTVNDKDIVVANNVTGGANINGAGILAGNPTTASFVYNNATTSWQINVGLTPSANGTLALGGTSNFFGTAYLAAASVTGNVTAGNVSGTNLTGTLLTAAQTNITSVGTLSALSVTGNVQGGNLRTAGLVSATGSITGAAITGSSLTVSTGNVTCGNIVSAGANGVGNIGSASNYFNTVFAKATSAQYADLAEMYLADQILEPGTVVCFGGAREVTVCDQDSSPRVAGVVSTNPSYIMNAGLTGDNVVAVALTGRVPTRVTGTVRKGDMLVAAGDGRARAEANPATGQVIGKALADFDGAEGVIEVVVGRL